MSSQVELFLSIQDERGAGDESQAILNAIAAEMESQKAQVKILSPGQAPADFLTKGDEPGNLLDIKIDLGALKSIVTWIYQRLTPGVKVKFKHKDSEFEFEGRNQEELKAAQEAFNDFVAQIEAQQ